MSLLALMALLAGLMLMAVIMLRLQHYFWIQRRLVELRFDAINDINWLFAQFVTNNAADSAYTPGNDFLHSWNAATSKARTLFPERTLHGLERVNACIRRAPEGDAAGAQGGIPQLVEMQTAVLRELYREAGLRPPR